MAPRHDDLEQELEREIRAELKRVQLDHEARLRILEERGTESRVKLGSIIFGCGLLGTGLTELLIHYFIK